MEKIVIVGFGGHARSVADSIIRQGKYEIVGYTDTDDKNNEYKYLGNDIVLDKLLSSGIQNIAIGIGYLGHTDVREKIYKKMKKIGYKFPVIIDPSAIVSKDSVIEEGTFIGKNVVINTNSHIGKLCIINTKSVVEHDCIVNDYSHIAVGAVLCGEVNIGKSVLIGANATIIQCRTVEDKKIIPAGSVVR